MKFLITIYYLSVIMVVQKLIKKGRKIYNSDINTFPLGVTPIKGLNNQLPDNYPVIKKEPDNYTHILKENNNNQIATQISYDNLGNPINKDYSKVSNPYYLTNNVQDTNYISNSPFYLGNEGSFSNGYYSINQLVSNSNNIRNNIHFELNIKNFSTIKSYLNFINNSMKSLFRLIPLNINRLTFSENLISNPAFEHKIHNLYLSVNYQKDRIIQIIDNLLLTLKVKINGPDDLLLFYRLSRRYRSAKLKMKINKRLDLDIYQQEILNENFDFKAEIDMIIEEILFLKNLALNYFDMVAVIYKEYPFDYVNIKKNSRKLNRIVNILFHIQELRLVFNKKYAYLMTYYEVIKKKRNKINYVIEKMTRKDDEYNCFICNRIGLLLTIIILNILILY